MRETVTLTPGWNGGDSPAVPGGLERPHFAHAARDELEEGFRWLYREVYDWENMRERFTKTLSEGTWTQKARELSVWQQARAFIRIVKAYHREEYEMEGYRKLNLGYFRKIMSSRRRRALAQSITEVGISLMIAAVILLGGFLFLKEQITVGGMALFALAFAMINQPMKQLTRSYAVFQESLAGAERIFDLLDMPIETPDPPDAVMMKGLGEGIEYRDVTFAYDTQPVLSGVSFQAAPGEVIAIVGSSGAGKSTLVDLLCRFYRPQRGTIRIGGVDLDRWPNGLGGLGRAVVGLSVAT